MSPIDCIQLGLAFVSSPTISTFGRKVFSICSNVIIDVTRFISVILLFSFL